ncbi:MAG: hypothetical protein ACE5IW_07615 [bacterium]
MNDKRQSDTSAFWGCTLPPDPKIIAEGWERRFIGDARMAREATDTYRELGYEVRLEPINTDGLKDECRGCKAIFDQFSAVYTRKIKE